MTSILCLTNLFLFYIVLAGLSAPWGFIFGGLGLCVTAILAAVNRNRTAFWATLPVLFLTLLLSGGPISHHGAAANESLAVMNLRTINTAEVSYLYSKGRYGTISDLIDAGLIDRTFKGVKDGYVLSLTLEGGGEGYVVQAIRENSNTGRWGYYSAPDAVVRYSTDPELAPIGQSGQWVQ